jgi:hypothetical protein
MIERRSVKRIPVTFRASFGSSLAGLREGTIIEATMSGCCLQSHAPVPVNTYLELWLQTSPTARIFVELAAVRWVLDGRCGIEFLSLRPEDRTKLHEIIKQPSSTE